MMGTTHDTDPTVAEDVHTVDERDQTTRVTTDPSLFGLAVPLPDVEPTVIDEPITERSDTSSDDPESDVATDPGPPPVRDVDEGGLGFKRNRLRAPRAGRRAAVATLKLERSDNGALATNGELYAKASVEARPVPKARLVEPAAAPVMIEPRVAAITAPMLRAAPAVVEGGVPSLPAPRPSKRAQETTNPGDVRRKRLVRRKVLLRWIVIAVGGVAVAVTAAALFWPRNSVPAPAPAQSAAARESIAAPAVSPATPAPRTSETVVAPATVEPPSRAATSPGVRQPAAAPINSQPRTPTPPLNPPTPSTTKPREVPPLRSIDPGSPPPHSTLAPPPAASSGPAPRFNQFFPEER